MYYEAENWGQGMVTAGGTAAASSHCTIANANQSTTPSDAKQVINWQTETDSAGFTALNFAPADPIYFDYNVTVHPDVERKFGTGFTERLRDALIGITDPELVSAFKRKKLIPCKTSDFDAIRDVAIEIGLLGKLRK